MASNTFNVLSICAGVGGLDLGVRLAVPIARTICFVEIEAYCCEILASRMEDKSLDEAPLWSNVKTFDGKPWRGIVDCIIGGYPCQPFSLSGRLRGSDDPRHLWPHIARIIEEVRPTRVFFENVANHLRLGFYDVCCQLQKLGYWVAAGCFSAVELGATHKRSRLYFMGYNMRGRCQEPKKDGFLDVSRKAAQNQRRQQTNNVTRAGCMVAFPPKPGDFAAWNSTAPGLMPALDTKTKSGVWGLVDGVANRSNRIHAAGNSVIPVVAAYAYRNLDYAITQSRRGYANE